MNSLATQLLPESVASKTAEGLVVLRNAAGDVATVSLFGGQVLSWCAAEDIEQLYCSPQAFTEQGRAIRGGVPVCFPQFANCGSLSTLPKHGFARTSMWHPKGALQTGTEYEIANGRFALSDSASTRSIWPFGFELELNVTVGAGWLQLELHVANPGAEAFDFTVALHTYLATADVRQAAVYGLEGIAYTDALNHNQTVTQASTAWQVAGELDRVYAGAPPALQVLQSGLPHLHIEQRGFVDTVVWNPGLAKAAALGDMPAADWTRMLCIEAAQVMTPVHLQPGNVWIGAQRLTQINHKDMTRYVGE